MLDNDDPNRLEGKCLAFFHILQMRKRQDVRMIRSVQDEDESTQKTTFFQRRKYEPIAVQAEFIEHMAEVVWRDLPTAWRD
jgi:hypothetical protein